MHPRFAVLAFLASIAVSAHGVAGTIPPQPRLIDQDGRNFTLASLRGTPLVVTFIAAHCKDVCPLVNVQTASAVARAQAEHLSIRFVTISLDPDHDSPRDMRILAHVFNADAKRWILATGTPRDVHAIMHRFHVIAEKGADGYADVHTTFVYFVDVDGHIRSTMLASTNMQDQELNAIRSNWEQLGR